MRSSSSHQLLEENMKLLAELKDKETICRCVCNLLDVCAQRHGQHTAQTQIASIIPTLAANYFLAYSNKLNFFRQLELEIEQIERKMHDVSHTHSKQMGKFN